MIYVVVNTALAALAVSCAVEVTGAASGVEGQGRAFSEARTGRVQGAESPSGRSPWG
jgi:hypothetical protein